MRVLGLDLSSTCIGWSVIDDNEQLIGFGAIELSTYKKKSFKLEYLEVAYRHIIEILIQYKPNICAIESTFNRNVLTLKSLAKMRGIAELACIQNGVKDIVEYMPSHIRKVVFEDGAMEKEAIYEILKCKYPDSGIFNVGYDISDSIALSLCYIFNSRNDINTIVKEPKKKSKKKKK